jgi:hypothetical protein
MGAFLESESVGYTCSIMGPQISFATSSKRSITASRRSTISNVTHTSLHTRSC